MSFLMLNVEPTFANDGRINLTCFRPISAAERNGFAKVGFSFRAYRMTKHRFWGRQKVGRHPGMGIAP